MSDAKKWITCAGCRERVQSLWDPPFCSETCRKKREVVGVDPGSQDRTAVTVVQFSGPEKQWEISALCRDADTEIDTLFRSYCLEMAKVMGAIGVALGCPPASDQQIEPPKKAPMTKTFVSTNGRDWVNLAQLEHADPPEKYPHWQIWEGDKLAFVHPPAPVVLSCEVEINGSACGRPGLVRQYRSISRVACDACYQEHQLSVGYYTARREGHVRAKMRMAEMDLRNVPEPRACIPILAGGIFNLSNSR